MATPNLERLDLSDTDTEDLFASPSRESRNPNPTDNFKVKQSREAESSGPNASTQARQQESRYDSEEARAAMLRKELNGVREINEVIEGVQASLERAKGNMEVCTDALAPLETTCCSFTNSAIYPFAPDGLTHCHVGIDAPEHLDPYLIPNRAQSTLDPQPIMARRNAGYPRRRE